MVPPSTCCLPRHGFPATAGAAPACSAPCVGSPAASLGVPWGVLMCTALVGLLLRKGLAGGRGQKPGGAQTGPGTRAPEGRERPAGKASPLSLQVLCLRALSLHTEKCYLCWSQALAKARRSRPPAPASRAAAGKHPGTGAEPRPPSGRPPSRCDGDGARRQTKDFEGPGGPAGQRPRGGGGGDSGCAAGSGPAVPGGGPPAAAVGAGPGGAGRPVGALPTPQAAGPQGQGEPAAASGPQSPQLPGAAPTPAGPRGPAGLPASTHGPNGPGHPSPGRGDQGSPGPAPSSGGVPAEASSGAVPSALLAAMLALVQQTRQVDSLREQWAELRCENARLTSEVQQLQLTLDALRQGRGDPPSSSPEQQGARPPTGKGDPGAPSVQEDGSQHAPTAGQHRPVPPPQGRELPAGAGAERGGRSLLPESCRAAQEGRSPGDASPGQSPAVARGAQGGGCSDTRSPQGASAHPGILKSPGPQAGGRSRGRKGLKVRFELPGG